MKGFIKENSCPNAPAVLIPPELGINCIWLEVVGPLSENDLNYIKEIIK